MEGMERRFDRTTQDIGNIIKLEHVNVTIPEQPPATLFYVAGLGLTRDPYIMVSTNNMWINVGQYQFHLPRAKPQVLRGCTGLVVPDREELLKRLSGVRKELEGTQFAFREDNSCVETVSPWGNRVRCHFPDKERFGRMQLGMPYVELDVPAGSAAGIVRFYKEIMEAPGAVADDERGRHARVSVGAGQDFIFRETDRPPAPYDGHHIQIYIADFSGPYRRLGERGLVTIETDQYEYRFKDITDLDSGKVLFTLEHEVRSLRHPLYGRPLVNRNPAQTNTDYMPGHDALAWSMA
jgi:hypothetical protein